MSCEDCSDVQNKRDRLDLLHKVLKGYLHSETPAGGSALTLEEKESIRKKYGIF